MNPIYTFTVPVFIKSLKALDALLTKAEGALTEKGLDEATVLEARLAPDMFPLKKQVQVACDNAKGAAARLSGTEIPSHPDDEQTFADLRARIQKTLAFVSQIPEDAFADAANRKATLPYFPGKYMDGLDYAREYALPNFFFHVVTAYAILRKEGFSIGKADYMGGVPLKDEA
jgi:hypothetical protein